jgi:hypothetical protein
MIKTVAEAIGKGLVAGLAGTAAMTLSSTLEMKLQGREPSTAPSQAAGQILGIEPRDSKGEARFSQVVHWSYGTGWGIARGLLGASGLDGAEAAAAHFAAVWGSAQIMLPALDVAPPLTEWNASTIATDVLHHAVYAAATSWAYSRIERAAGDVHEKRTSVLRS